MSVKQRKDGRYFVKYKTIDGWKQKSFRALADAEAFDREVQYDKDAETCSRLTVSESMQAFLKATKHAPKTVKAYYRVLEILGDGFCDQYVDSLTRRDLETARDIFKDRGTPNISINRYIGMLIASWRWCASEDLVSVVPWEKYRKLPEGPHRHLIGSLDDFRAVYAICPPYLQWFVRTCLALCCRPGKEVVSLLWKDVHLDEGYAVVWMHKVSAQKVVRLPQWWIDEARSRKGADTDRVCPGKRGGNWLPKFIWGRACAKAGVKNCPLYTLRHLAASRMLEAGADLAAVAAQLGHKNVTTTGAFYTHAIERAQRHAADLIPAPNVLVQKEEK